MSQFHDIFCVGAGGDEVHGNWRFLAWHRAYLVTYERILREVSGEPKLALPYWDWFGEDKFPQAFSVGALSHGRRDLNSGGNQIITANDRGLRENSNYNERRPFGPLQFIPPDRIIPTGFFGWKGPEDDGGRAEYVAHGGIHNWVGGLRGLGDMANLNTAAKDPCFYSHHSNVDRIWEIWKTDIYQGGDVWKLNLPQDWLSIEFAFNFDNQRRYRYRIQDLLETEELRDLDGNSLAYRYDTTAPRHPVPTVPSSPLIASLSARSPHGARAQTTSQVDADDLVGKVLISPVRLALGSVALGRKLGTTTPVAISPELRSDALRAFKNALEQPSAFTFEGLSNLPENQRLSEGRAAIRIQRLVLPPKNLQLRFFLNNPNATLETPVDDPSFIGEL